MNNELGGVSATEGRGGLSLHQHSALNSSSLDPYKAQIHIQIHLQIQYIQLKIQIQHIQLKVQIQYIIQLKIEIYLNEIHIVS